MRPILILTKNLLVEQKLQEKLHHLDYEVFCSVNMIKQLQNSLNRVPLIEYYKLIIFSETLNNQEVCELVNMLQHRNSQLIRKSIVEPTTKEKEEMSQLGINTWIYNDMSLENLREQLTVSYSAYKQIEHVSGAISYDKEDMLEMILEFKSILTKMERKTFECLVESEEELVSREELCYYLWKSEPNNSHLTQMSGLVKRLKSKLVAAGFPDGMVETVWGYGYRLAPNLKQIFS
ncbi:helix-turn-helix domain-containing protein [Enterococcus sp. AZ109]|uniref:helix-turn-helix domain-containing protein n=1 Tax=Enterococcus sp. AZ109 TaxID=2774634 RepID=UPI003F25708B